MIGSEHALRPAGTHPSGASDAPVGRVARSRLDRPVAAAVGVCFVLAVASVLILSWVPSSDPWAWIDWGQEIASSKVAIGLAGGPSWKPFPAVFTSVFGFFGGAAPGMWLVVTRTAALLALVAAFRLGKRFAGPAAGILAVLALCLIQDWPFYVARGASEPIVAALTLWAVDRHLNESPRLAYFLIFLAALNRPEFSPILALYALYLWLRVPGSRPLAVALLVLVPVAWLVPPWLITGNPLQAGSAALAGKGSPGSAIAELKTSPALNTAPILVLAAIGLAFAYRRRERTLLWVGAAAIAWALMVAVMTQVAYGLPRYLLPAATIGCLFAGIAVVRIAQLAGEYVSRTSPALGRSAWPAVAVGGLVVLATLPWTIPRVRLVAQQVRQADQAAHIQQRLFTSVGRVGGSRVVLPCRSSHVAVNHSLASALAWKLQVPLRRVRPLMEGTGVVFSAPHESETGTTPRIVHASARRIRVLATVPPWVVVEVTRRAASATPHCAPAIKRESQLTPRGAGRRYPARTA
jgi:hypothetical protein